MIRVKSALVLLTAILVSLFAQSANAFDFQVFTWERGKIQQVIIGETKRGTDWKVEMVGQGIEPIRFIPSSQNDAGYYVFTAEIPNDLPIGAYSIEATGDNGPKRIIAGISLVEAVTFEITKTSDLSSAIALLTFITATFSTLRAIKYSRLKNPASKEPEIVMNEENRLKRVFASILNLRSRLTNSVNPSLFRHLLSQESAFLAQLSKPAYYLFPLIGILLGSIAGLDAQANGGFENSSLLFFFIIVIIGLVDAFSGIVALFAFWVVQFYFGEISNLRDLLIVSAAAIAWIGPALLSRIYQDAILIDLREAKVGNFLAKTLSILGAGLAAIGIFFGGHLLLQSLILQVSDDFKMKSYYLVIVGLVAAAKASYLTFKFDDRKDEVAGEFEVVRVASPQISLLVLGLVFGYAYIWTDNLSRAIVAAILFAIPYSLLFMRFETLGVEIFAKVRRNIVIEAAIATGLSLVIYSQLQRLPELTEDRAELFLILSALPALFHGFFSSICDSAQRKERIAS